MTEDEAPPPKAHFTVPPLDRLGVAELQRYVLELRAEIERVDAEITRKQNHLSAADDVFRKL